MSYERMKRNLEQALTDLEILSGDVVGPSDTTWQDVAGTAVVNLQLLAADIENARNGKAGPFPVFPSPNEWKEDKQ